ncbi:hypothetical protein WJX79_003030 [Trebouxia sp. C0005]
MPSNCLCLRPRHCTSPNDGKVCQAKRSRVTPPVNLQPPVRAVSPEDVRRTASGRLVKQRSDQGLPGPRDQPATMLVRLNSGISMLAKMLSNGTRATSMLQPFITGPEKVDTAVWVMTYTFKQGVIEYGIRSQFSFTADKITMIHNSRI